MKKKKKNNVESGWSVSRKLTLVDGIEEKKSHGLEQVDQTWRRVQKHIALCCRVGQLKVTDLTPVVYRLQMVSLNED